MEDMILRGQESTCQRCGCTENIGSIGLCKACESLVDDEYALMYQDGGTMEITCE